MMFLKLLLFVVLAISLIFVGAFILPIPGFSPAPGIIFGTLVFLVISVLSIIIVDRNERKRKKAVYTEKKFLQAFQRWIRRIQYGVNEQFIKLKYKQSAGIRRAYLEDFRRVDLEHIRSDLPTGYRLSEFGQIDRIDRGELNLDEILDALEKQGWYVYYVRQASPDQLFTIQHLRRGVENLR